MSASHPLSRWTRLLYKAICIIALLTGLNQHVAQSQTDTEFWFVAPDISSSVGDEPIALRFTAFDEPATVTISMPAQAGFTPFTVNIPANTQLTVRSDDPAYSALFNTAKVENKPINTINNKGLLITATSPITTYYEALNPGNPEAFILKGDNALGTRFIVPSQDEFNNDDTVGNPKPYEQVNIVATEDNTTVTITVPANKSLAGHAAGSTITLTLNKGETYSVQSTSQDDAINLAGIEINADKDIAVTISDDSIKQSGGAAKVQPRDLIGDQLIPVTTLGTEYIAIRTGTSPPDFDRIFIVTTEDDTEFEIFGQYKGLLGTNQQFSFPVTNQTGDIYIKTNKPIYVYQISGLQQQNRNDFGSAILPHIACTGSRTISFTRNFSSTFNLQLMVKGKDRDNFTL